MQTLKESYTCAGCQKRKKKVYSYYGPGNGVKLCSKACRDAYINYKREEANERARKRNAQAQRQAPASTSKKSGFRFLGIQLW